MSGVLWGTSVGFQRLFPDNSVEYDVQKLIENGAVRICVRKTRPKNKTLSVNNVSFTIIRQSCKQSFA